MARLTFSPFGTAAVVSTLAMLSLSPAARAEQGHFHHVHLNVTDVGQTSDFYQMLFGVVPIRYAGHAPALLTDRSFLFMSEVTGPIRSQHETGVIHIGWSGVDGPSEYAWWVGQGVQVQQPLTPLLNGHYTYFYNPDHEIVELWTVERHHRLNHVHMLSSHAEQAAHWLASNVGAGPVQAGDPIAGNFNVVVDNVTFHIFPATGGIPPLTPADRAGPLQPTEGSSIDHLAFSFRDLFAAYRRIKDLGTEIVRPIRWNAEHGVLSFFIRSPDGVLVEIVKARPLPDAAWE